MFDGCRCVVRRYNYKVFPKLCQTSQQQEMIKTVHSPAEEPRPRMKFVFLVELLKKEL